MRTFPSMHAFRTRGRGRRSRRARGRPSVSPRPLFRCARSVSKKWCVRAPTTRPRPATTDLLPRPPSAAQPREHHVQGAPRGAGRAASPHTRQADCTAGTMQPAALAAYRSASARARGCGTGRGRSDTDGAPPRRAARSMADMMLGVVAFMAVGWAFAYGDDDGSGFVGTSQFFLEGTRDYASWFFQFSFAGARARSRRETRRMGTRAWQWGALDGGGDAQRRRRRSTLARWRSGSSSRHTCCCRSRQRRGRTRVRGRAPGWAVRAAR